jgi:hypothetical protein
VSGRGNNWAFGFFGEEDDDTEKAMEEYRKIAEASYKNEGVFLFHSLAGGTGSGLGSRLSRRPVNPRLVQEIRQEYSKSPILTASFAPFEAGETAVQAYNTLLSLHILQNNADFIGYLPNDSLLNCVERSHLNIAGPGKAPPVKIDAMNDYAANCLAGLVLPLNSVSPSSVGQIEKKYF